MSVKILFFLLLISNFSLYANDITHTSKKTYTLQECIDIAIMNNYDLMVARQQVTAASADLTNAFGNYLPRMDFNMGYSRILNPDATRTVNLDGISFEIPGSNPDSYSMNASLSMPLFDGFSREANYKRAQTNLSAMNLNNEQAILSLRQMVYAQYVEVIKNYKIVQIRRENFEQSKFELSRLQALHESGSISITDVYSQEAELANREIEIIIAENTLNKSKASLLAMMGLAPDAGADFLESSLPNTIDDAEIVSFRREIGSLNSAVNQAINSRLDLKAFKFSMDASEARVRSVMGQYLPAIYASGGWTWNHSEFNSFSERGRSFLGLQLNFPIFSNFSTNLQVQSSKLQFIQSEVQYAKKEQEIRQLVQNSFLNLDAAEKQIEVSKRALFAAEKSYESFKERYNVGAASIIEITFANSQLITSRINRVNAIYNYLQAKNDVLFSIGMIK
jgi:outer membrane protein